MSTTYCFTLSEAQTKMLLSVLDNYDDCGPRYEGWQSDELKDVRDAIRTRMREIDKDRRTPE